MPRVYAISHPLLFFGMSKREFGPVLAVVAVLYYLVTSKQLVSVSLADIGFRLLLSLVYNLLRNPDRLGWRAWQWLVPGILFYYIPLPAIHVWSMLTLTADGWGTSMRASEMQVVKPAATKQHFGLLFFVLWMAVLAGAAAKFISAYFHLFLVQRWALVLVSMSIAYLGAWKATAGEL